MALPMLIATRAGTSSPGIWLFVLTMFSTVTAAVAGQAASRSRALWLRRSPSRAGYSQRWSVPSGVTMRWCSASCWR